MTVLGLLIFALVVVQFARIIGENVALARELSSTQSDIATLEARREHAHKVLRRLGDPDGAIPDIHDRLKLVRDDEAIIFISPAPSETSTPAP